MPIRQINAELDKYMNPQNAPISMGTPPYAGNMFDSVFERDSVTTPKIRSFNFNSGFGGTLTLGGTVNGNGVLNIKDSTGSTIVNANNTGITINNNAGSTIIDSTGLVSTSSFPNNGKVIAFSGGNKIGSVTGELVFTTLTNGTTPASMDIVVTRPTKIFISGRADLELDEPVSGTVNSGGQGMLAITFGTTRMAWAGFISDYINYGSWIRRTGYNGGIFPTYVDYFGQVSTGTTTISLQGYKYSLYGTNTLDVYGYSFNYFLLGT